MIEVAVAGLGVVPPASAPLVLLKEHGGERVLPIGIGPLEAHAIALPLQGATTPRPMTHDAFTDVIGQLGGHVRRVEITQLVDNTFYARLILQQAELERDIDIRPSDAIALALRAEAPIFVAEAVMDQAGIIAALSTEGSTSTEQTEAPREPVDPAKLEVFREFIETLDNLDPEDPEHRS